MFTDEVCPCQEISQSVQLSRVRLFATPWIAARQASDILECEVKWALGSITMNIASGGDGIPVELFQILKDDTIKVPHAICQQIWKTQQWPQDWKRSIFIPISKKGNAKECSNYSTIALISLASKAMFKACKLDFNSTWNESFQMFKLGLEKT